MAELKPTVLIVEDEKQIRRFVGAAFEEIGWLVYEADTLASGLSAASTRNPDLLILDLGLPDGDGIELLRDLRTWSAVPVIVLSARVRESDKVEALDAGADDYLTKPFGLAELLARVRAASRRRSGKDEGAGVFECGEIILNTRRRTVSKGGVDVHLTPIEYRLLCLLTANEGMVLTHRQLLTDIWGPSRAKDGHYVRGYMRHLRHKLETDPSQPRHILTEPGVGYRLVRLPRM
jgi:two-component system KDP operon response regulator KdpE